MKARDLAKFVNGDGEPGMTGSPRPTPARPGSGSGMASELSEQYENLMPLLAHHGQAIEALAVDLGVDPQDAFDSVAQPPETIAELRDGLDELEAALREGLSALREATLRDVMEIAGALFDDGHIEDLEVVAGWLQLVAVEVYGSVRDVVVLPEPGPV